MQPRANRKGILFTVVTIFLLTSVFLLSASYVKRNKMHQDMVAEAAMAEKARFIHEDIVSDFLLLLDIVLDEITRNSTSVTLKFTNFSTIADDTTYNSTLQSYETFIEGTFSNITNTVITMKDFSPDFYFYPYNSSFQIKGRTFFFYVKDYNRLNYIDIVVRTNDTNASVSSAPSNDSSGNPKIILTVTDGDGATIGSLSSKTYILDATGTDQKIVIDYEVSGTNPNMTIEFGRHTEVYPYATDIITDGTLYIAVNDLQAQIDKFHIDYNLTGKDTILQTNATIYLE